ncbi:MAG: 4'-phosphopantetheinyl transferase superfamily protein [Myxococcales bacterium]|nr:4'-phosphopantetheinyl transferase superfamily protein [Myxococcales bacterium]MCB9530922.1 4'-phosphopantetheinyl transferase superfamily protein [Myxococcales bacterium]MCB9534524.1 4'-phosphopantetheinyl transferase superfamily protein [Myxococcales bacterium]
MSAPRLWLRGIEADLPARGTLGPDEAARVEAMPRADARAASRAARELAREAASELFPHVAPADWLVETGSLGKPEWRGPGEVRPAVSVAHTGGLVAVAAAPTGMIGVDVERVTRRARVDALAARFFAPAEAAWLSTLTAVDRREAFFALWTAKEAVTKCFGAALGVGIGGVELAPFDVEAWVLDLEARTHIEGEAASAVRLPGPTPVRVDRRVGAAIPRLYYWGWSDARVAVAALER